MLHALRLAPCLPSFFSFLDGLEKLTAPFIKREMYWRAHGTWGWARGWVQLTRGHEGLLLPQVQGAKPLTLVSPVCLFEDEELGEDRGTSLNKEKKNLPLGQSLVLRAICPYLQAGRQWAALVSHLGIVHVWVREWECVGLDVQDGCIQAYYSGCCLWVMCRVCAQCQGSCMALCLRWSSAHIANMQLQARQETALWVFDLPNRLNSITAIQDVRGSLSCQPVWQS